MSRRLMPRFVALAVGLAVLIAACSVFGIQLWQDEPSGGDIYTGEDAATITVTTAQVGCCYTEGSLHFAELEGPSAFDWAIDDGSGADDWDGETLIIGRQTSSVRPGDYALTAWEQVCSGNCGNLDGPTNHCSLEFTLESGHAIQIDVTYTIPEPCVATIR